MKRVLFWTMFVAIAFSLARIPVLAQGRGHGAGGMHAGGRGGAPGQVQAGPRTMPPASASRVPMQLAKHPGLTTRLQPLLPTGMTVDEAAQGFRNLGQFVAAVHVSKNLGIPFADLKQAMTGSQPQSLGRAIQTLRPNLTPDQVKQDVGTAEQETKTDLAASKSEPKS